MNIQYPAILIKKYTGDYIYREDGLVYIRNDSKGSRLVDNTNLDYPTLAERRLRIPKNMKCRLKGIVANNLKDILTCRYNNFIIDYLGNISTRNDKETTKLKYFKAMYFIINNTRYIFIKDLNFYEKVSGFIYKKYAGILFTKYGYIVYNFTDKWKKDTYRKI